MKVFISQPMKGLSDKEILYKRNKIINIIENTIHEDVEIIDSFLEGFKPEGNIPVAYLGKSISLLSKADIVYFCEGWENARGCSIEHLIATNYGMVIMEENNE